MFPYAFSSRLRSPSRLLGVVLGMLLMVLSFSGSRVAYAAESIAVTPLISDYVFQRGETYAEQIRVSNPTGKAMEVSFEVFDIEVGEGNGISFLPEESKGNSRKSLASWVVPSGDESFELAPGEQKDFAFEYQIPENVAPGDYYASLNMYFRPVDKLDTGSLKVRQSIGSLALVSLYEEDPTEDVLSEELLDPEQFDFQLSVPAVELKNDGVHVSVDFTNDTLRYARVRPVLTVVDASGEVFYKAQGAAKRVFPGKSWTFSDAVPIEYVVASEGMVLEYRLEDQNTGNVYLGQDISLESYVPEANAFLVPFAVPVPFVVFLVGALVLVVVVLVYRRHRRT